MRAGGIGGMVRIELTRLQLVGNSVGNSKACLKRVRPGQVTCASVVLSDRTVKRYAETAAFRWNGKRAATATTVYTQSASGGGQ